MHASTLSPKGRTTVPHETRVFIGAGPGTRLAWHVLRTGLLLVRAKTHSVLDLAGSLKARKGKRVSIKAMNPWR